MRQLKTLKNLDKGMPMGEAMRKAGYKDTYARSPHELVGRKSWKELMELCFPDEDLVKIHKGLLNSKRLDHMVFSPPATDDEIKILIDEAGCVLRKIVYGEAIKHVYFWAPDNLSRDRALDKAYKLKGKYAATEVKITGAKLFDLAFEGEKIDEEIRRLDEEERRLLREIERSKDKKNTARKRKKTAGKKENRSEHRGAETSAKMSVILPEPEVGGVHSDGGAGK